MELVSTGFDASAWRGRRVFVTGANGFLGSWLTRLLVDAGATVVCLIRDQMPLSLFNREGTIDRVVLVPGMLEDYGTLERALNEFEIEACFHLAAQAIVTTAQRLPLSTFQSNIAGTYNLLEAARRYGRLERLVVMTSDKVYGDHTRLPYTEDGELLGINPYDVSKVCGDLLTQCYVRTYGLPAGIARCGNLYGPGDLNFSRIVPGTIRSLLDGKRPEIRSDGSYVRDYFYVGDAAEALLTLGQELHRPEVRGQAFNFGTEEPMEVVQIVNLLRGMAGRLDLEALILNTARAEIKAQYLACEKARRVLGWRHRTDVATGLKTTFEWYEHDFAADPASSLAESTGR